MCSTLLNIYILCLVLLICKYVNFQANKLRKNFIAASPDCAVDVVVKALDLDPNLSNTDLVTKLREAHLSRDDRPMKELDLAMKSKTDEIQNNISKLVLEIHY